MQDSALGVRLLMPVNTIDMSLYLVYIGRQDSNHRLRDFITKISKSWSIFVPYIAEAPLAPPAFPETPAAFDGLFWA